METSGQFWDDAERGGGKEPSLTVQRRECKDRTTMRLGNALSMARRQSSLRPSRSQQGRRSHEQWVYLS